MGVTLPGGGALRPCHGGSHLFVPPLFFILFYFFPSPLNVYPFFFEDKYFEFLFSVNINNSINSCMRELCLSQLYIYYSCLGFCVP